MKKRCSRCKQDKALTEFYKDSGGSDGLRSSCKQCFRSYRQTEHGKAVCRAAVDRYQKTAKGKAAAKRFSGSVKRQLQQLAYRQTDAFLQKISSYRKSEGGMKALKEGKARYKKTEKARLAGIRYRTGEVGRATRKRNSKNEAGRAAQKRKFAKRRAATIVALTATEWRTILNQYNHRCAYCGRDDLKLTQDHYLPLKLGGTHTKGNVVPACGPCNSRKSARHPHRLF